MLAYILLLAAATPEAKPNQNSKDDQPFCVDCVYHKAPPERQPAETMHRAPSRARVTQPRNNPGTWVTVNDYPATALRMEEEGTSAFHLEIGKDGRVQACTITMSSGSATLDAATCTMVTRRARFIPALDDDGNPVIGSYRNRVRWMIPAEPSYAEQIEMTPTGPQPTYGVYTEITETDYPLKALEQGEQGDATLVLAISADGTVTSCEVRAGTGSALLDKQSCDIAKQWTFLPARNAAGDAVAGTAVHEFAWNLPDAWKEYKRTGLYPPKP